MVDQAQNAEEIGAMAFLNCGALERIECSDELSRIGEKAFYRCHSLKWIDLPSSIKRIGREALGFYRVHTQIHILKNAAENIVIEERGLSNAEQPH